MLVLEKNRTWMAPKSDQYLCFSGHFLGWLVPGKELISWFMKKNGFRLYYAQVFATSVTTCWSLRQLCWVMRCCETGTPGACRVVENPRVEWHGGFLLGSLMSREAALSHGSLHPRKRRGGGSGHLLIREESRYANMLTHECLWQISSFRVRFILREYFTHKNICHWVACVMF